MNLLDEMAELESAEEFLDYFELPYDPSVVHVNRLHILQKFHDLMQEQPAPGADEAALHAHYRELLASAYHCFVESDARSEKLFKVFRAGEPQTVFVPMDAIGRGGGST